MFCLNIKNVSLNCNSNKRIHKWLPSKGELSIIHSTNTGILNKTMWLKSTVSMILKNKENTFYFSVYFQIKTCLQIELCFT